MHHSIILIASVATFAAACGADDVADLHDPDTAPNARVDRFAAGAGTLMVRDEGNGLPGANEPVDFDRPPFITTGLGPAGEVVRYYNFDVRPVEPAPIYVLFGAGASEPLAGQLNIIDAVPGDPGYNDFWQVVRVTVDDDYVANQAASLADLEARGFAMEPTSTIVNCPVVPEGSTAELRLDGGDAELVQGWYRGEVVSYFHFGEAPLTVVNDSVPTSPIYVTFNVDPGEPGGGPPSGFVTEPGSEQTHNVIASVPGQPGYSPLWAVNIYDNADFDAVSDLTSAEAASLLVPYAAMVNCPVVTPTR